MGCPWDETALIRVGLEPLRAPDRGPELPVGLGRVEDPDVEPAPPSGPAVRRRRINRSRTQGAENEARCGEEGRVHAEPAQVYVPRDPDRDLIRHAVRHRGRDLVHLILREERPHAPAEGGLRREDGIPQAGGVIDSEAAELEEANPVCPRRRLRLINQAEGGKGEDPVVAAVIAGKRPRGEIGTECPGGNPRLHCRARDQQLGGENHLGSPQPADRGRVPEEGTRRVDRGGHRRAAHRAVDRADATQGQAELGTGRDAAERHEEKGRERDEDPPAADSHRQDSRGHVGCKWLHLSYRL